MDRKSLEALADKHQAKADRAYRNYQETGISRYDNERRKNEDIADAMRMAAAASDDHQKVIHLRATLADLSAKAAHIEYMPEDQKPKALESLRKNLLAMARLEGIRSDLS